jgi:uncharacterized protein YdhG (YjbR/CyaY superfamily)
MSDTKSGVTTVEEYIASFPEETRQALEEVRAIIRSAAPDVRESISYKMAAFGVNGKDFIYLAGWKKHLSVYPIPAGSDAFNEQISKYTDGKGTVKFPLDEPLPLKLIEKVVKYRLADHVKINGTKSK